MQDKFCKTIVEQMPAGILTVQWEVADSARSPRICWGNQSAAALLGLSAIPPNGIPLTDVSSLLTPSDLVERCRAALSGLDEENSSATAYEDAYLVRKTNRFLQVQIYAVGENVCSVVLHDVTAQKQASDRFLHAQRLAHVGDWVWDLQTNDVTFSAELARIFGVDEETEPLTFEHVMEIVHPGDRADIHHTVEQTIETLQPFSIQFRLLRDGVEERVVHTIGHAVTDASATPVQLWGTTQDVTAHWLAGEALRSSESQLRAIAESAHDAIISFDSRSRIVFWNPSAITMFEMDAETAMGRSITEFIPAIRFAAREDGRMQLTIDDAYVERNISLETAAHTSHGEEFPVEVSLGTWTHHQSIYYTAIVRNITLRRNAEDELRQFTRQLEASNRELQDFAYIASHDLQEPLRKINAFSDRLRGKYADVLDDTANDYMERIQSAARRMQTLINDLLVLSRVTTQGQPFHPTDLTEIAQAVLSDLETTIEDAGGDVLVEPLPVLEADPLQMRQLLQNLITNGLKFRRPDVKPVVRVYSEPGRSADNGRVYCSILVEDNGIGFEEKYLERIFQPFQRLHGRSSYTGTGMGLAICRKIVERHGGLITAQSKPDEGTTFIVKLPTEHPRTEE